jgi:hypothetical protein
VLYSDEHVTAFKCIINSLQQEVIVSLTFIVLHADQLYPAVGCPVRWSSNLPTS